jgi:hypothetical protein
MDTKSIDNTSHSLSLENRAKVREQSVADELWAFSRKSLKYPQVLVRLPLLYSWSLRFGVSPRIGLGIRFWLVRFVAICVITDQCRPALCRQRDVQTIVADHERLLRGDRDESKGGQIKKRNEE